MKPTLRMPPPKGDDHLVQLVIRATKEKKTPRTWRFKADDETSPVRYLYVRKEAFAAVDVPQKIVITIEVDDASV